MSQRVGDGPAPANRGLFLHCMNLRITGIRIGAPSDGIARVDGRPEISLDLFPHWLTIAVGHTEALAQAHEDLVNAWAVPDHPERGSTWEAEVLLGMQVITASAIAWDALYATTTRYVQIPSETMEAWRRNRTSRPAYILETLRRGYRVRNESVRNLKTILREVFKYRNWAAHPPAAFGAPVIHPELNVATDWRYVAFRYENAYQIARMSIMAIAQLITRPRALSQGFPSLCKGVSPRIHQVVKQWELRFGPVVPDEVRDLLLRGSLAE